MEGEDSEISFVDEIPSDAPADPVYTADGVHYEEEEEDNMKDVSVPVDKEYFEKKNNVDLSAEWKSSLDSE
jgi:hypothetical protein